MRDPIVLQEYESLTVELSPMTARRLSATATGRLAVSVGSAPDSFVLTAGSHVGTIVVGDTSVLIRPKVELNNLFHMLGVAPPAFTDDRFRFAVEPDVLTVMAEVFAHEVDRATLRGVHRGYRHMEERLVSPRGRIDVTAQMRRPGFVSPIACRYDEFTADTFANRCLVAATDRLMRSLGRVPVGRIALRRIQERFDDVAHVEVDPESVDRWRPTRLDQHYEAAMRLAAVILRSLSLDLSTGTTTAATFLVDMNDLFQRFVADRLERAMRSFGEGLSVVEEPTVHLAAGHRLPMRPDLVIRRAGSWVHVADVKYKLSTGPGRMSDYYQVLAYATAMGLREATLIYAQDPGDQDDPIGGSRVHTSVVRNAGTELHVYRVPVTGTNEELDGALVGLARWIAERSRPGLEEAA